MPAQWWNDQDGASHLAKDTGMTGAEFARETGVRPRWGADLARDTAMTDDEFAAETGGHGADITLGQSAPPPD